MFTRERPQRVGRDRSRGVGGSDRLPQAPQWWRAAPQEAPPAAPVGAGGSAALLGGVVPRGLAGQNAGHLRMVGGL